MGITNKAFGRTVGQSSVKTILISFETGEQCDYRIYFNSNVMITGIKGIVVKAIAATNNGTITGANSTGASTAGVITANASDALGTEYSVTPTSNNTVASGSYYQLTSLKSTAGGKVLVTIQYKSN
jgi:hypothetical protein